MGLRHTLAISLCCVLAASASWAGSKPVAVSPGSATGEVIADRCPTFSWGEVEGASSYELIVYRVPAHGEESKPVLRETFPGAVESWTPSLRQCLERGTRYVWSVRARGRREASEWSPPHLFEVAAWPSQLEFEAALEVVRSYLAAGGDPDESTEATSESTEAPKGKEPASNQPRLGRGGPAATQLSVDGNIDATSFTGDGAHLDNVATEAELSAHAVDASAHHTKTTSFSDLIDTATDAQIPDSITVDHASSAATAATANALAVDPSACPTGEVVTDIAADGTLTCTPTIDALSFVFVSSGKYTGDLVSEANALTGYSGSDGLAAGDAICSHLATAAGLMGSYKAWLSTSVTNAKDRVQSRGWFRTDGSLVAYSVADLLNCTKGPSGSDCLRNSISLSEQRDPIAFPPWTGTLTNGMASSKTCSDWTSGSVAVSGQNGHSSSVTTPWTGTVFENFSCNSELHIYCFKQ